MTLHLLPRIASNIPHSLSRNHLAILIANIKGLFNTIYASIIHFSCSPTYYAMCRQLNFLKKEPSDKQSLLLKIKELDDQILQKFNELIHTFPDLRLLIQNTHIVCCEDYSAIPTHMIIDEIHNILNFFDNIALLSSINACITEDLLNNINEKQRIREILQKANNSTPEPSPDIFEQYIVTKEPEPENNTPISIEIKPTIHDPSTFELQHFLSLFSTARHTISQNTNNSEQNPNE